MKNIFDGLSRLAMTHEESLSLMSSATEKRGKKTFQTRNSSIIELLCRHT